MQLGTEAFTIQKGNIFAVPILHYNMEMASYVHLAFQQIKPDCVAVELPETLQLQMLHASSRLPDLGVVVSEVENANPNYFLCEPCEGTFEALRSAQENQAAAYCIDLDIEEYPENREAFPDPYSLYHIGLKNYYEAYLKALPGFTSTHKLDAIREQYMAKRLKELSLRYDRVLFVGGMYHVDRILKLVDSSSFPDIPLPQKPQAMVATLTEQSAREVMAECGWITKYYEEMRSVLEEAKELDPLLISLPPDRQKMIYQLYKEASEKYCKETGNAFPGYNMRNIMKFLRNYALLHSKLMPNLFQILYAAKGCVDSNFAYETWELATSYPFLKNIDGLPELNLTSEQVWGNSKILRFQLKQRSRKDPMFRHKRKDKSNVRITPPGPFSICSYPPEDLVIESFGKFLQKKGTQILTEESGKTIPFSSSIEDGVDTRETIRHWAEKKLFVKVRGKPPGGVGSVVVIFDEDKPGDTSKSGEKYPWRTTWIGEHEQESDMALYATSVKDKVVGPGISRCEYGGFMMSYPPRRMYDIWSDSDYSGCRTKAEVLLAAAIDYAIKPVVVYVAASPPRTLLKNFARRYGKKVVYIPIGQLSPVILNKIRVFHVLDGHNRRDIASEYIF